MPRVKISDDIREKILADWRTGEYTIRTLAHRHDVSSATAGKIVKDVPKDLLEIIDAGVKYRSAILSEKRQVGDALSQIVDEKTRHIAFFANATVKNVSLMMEKIGGRTTIDEHKTAQDTLLKGRETVLGKSPETAIQINNQLPKKSLEDYSDEELIDIIEGKN
ncbi:MAG: hypothetical protein VST70_01605 [Nitrospirota bacterium]|nr:hypothetical protein [Nitrospirota bacterium]